MEEIADEEFFESVFEKNSDVGAAIVSPDGQWLRVNGYLCDMLGYEEAELLQLTFQEITHPEDLASEQPYLQRLRDGGIDHYRFRKRYVHRDGHIVWGLLDRSVLRDAERQPRYFISRIRDITVEKAAEPPETMLSKLKTRVRGIFQKQ